MLEKGFSLKFSFGFPPDAYGYDGDLPVPDDLLLNTTFGLEIGNQWYFYTSENFGIGLDVNWFDIMYGRSKMDVMQSDPIYRYTLEASLLEFGPVATYAINDIFAIEGYYNLRPSYMATLIWENQDSNLVFYEFGFLHGLGIGARVKFAYIGFEHNFGSVDGQVDGSGELGDEAEFLDKQPLSASNSRLVIGFQF
jgi:hypothetical protein